EDDIPDSGQLEPTEETGSTASPDMGYQDSEGTDKSTDQPEASTQQEADESETALAEERRQIVARELEKRQSANAVFQAKYGAREKKRKRYFIAAAVALLVLPVAAGSYWFITALQQSSSSQIPASLASGMQNRGFLGEDPPSAAATQAVSEAVPAETDPAPGTASVATDPAQDNARQTASTTAQPDVDNVDDVESTVQSASSVSAESTITPPGGTETVFTPPSQPPARNQATPAPPTGAPTTEASENLPAIALDSSADNQAAAIDTGASAQDISVQQTPGLSVTRRAPVSGINPNLLAAYDSFQSGDYIRARELYQMVLREQANNRDAILGLAVVSRRSGDTLLARGMYLRLLELNPEDMLARAGLLDTLPATDALGLESELKSLVELNPDIAPLAFALGNLYASQSRWNEAQNAYYNALLSAKTSNINAISPDYAFNLAVSLERLGQFRQARNYYLEALESARGVAPGFNREQVNQRLEYLEQVIE
ncbi:MAG: hypothetical protein WD601_14590, partial [Pseudohongiellaceae bacterium]